MNDECHFTPERLTLSLFQQLPELGIEASTMDGAKVLVVEDEAVVALDLKDRLVDLGYSVPAFVSSGEEAIRRAAEEQPDLVLMDVRLKGEMNGIEAAEVIRDRFNIPVVYLTAFADDDTLRRAQMTAPFGYLVKPFEALQLHATIKMALHKHKLERALHESEERLRHYAERLTILHEVDQAILAAESPEAIARAALVRMRRLAPYRQASVILFDFSADRATVLAAQANGETRLKEEMRFPLAAVQGIPVLEQGGHYLVEDVLTLPEHLAPDEQLLAEGVRSYVSLPLIAQGELIGSLNLEATEPGAFGGEEIDVAHRVASSLAVAVCQARLHESVEHYCSELEARNQDLGAFAHTVAHDLKEPLSVITGFSAALQDDFATMPDAELQHYLTYIARSGFKMARIIHELLLLAEVREEDVERMPLDLADVVTEAQKHLRHMIDEHQAEVTLPDSWPVALGYAPWVEEVWVNYISNAIKYGGKPPHMELGATVQSDGQVRCWVQDDGPGISLEDQGRLFTPFTRCTQRHTPGHGLGLSIVKRIVEKLGGQVGVESRLGQGSTFYFTLPVATDGKKRRGLNMERVR